MNDSMSGSELMALVVISYNQEKFIAEAVRAALSQTYEPLEIVFSDDASSDGTWDFIQEETKSYAGPHRIILNRNEQNLGLMGNLFGAVSLSRAGYIVVASGDDISLPERVSKTARAFLAGRGSIAQISSNAIFIDRDSRPIVTPVWPKNLSLDVERVFDQSIIVGGAGSAYRREVFDAFPRPDNAIYNEDAVFTNRSAMVGAIEILPDELIKYRVHENSLSKLQRFPRDGSELVAREVKQLRYWGIVQNQQLADVTFAMNAGKLPRSVGNRLAAIMLRHITNSALILEMFLNDNIAKRVAPILRLRRFRFKRRMKLLLIAISPQFYIYLEHLRLALRGGKT